ncbi:alpha/beta fold hydrolase [Paenibacillus segetis]|uniref:Alpha/beta fold hydrolase n=1 Tax=Paenibacillus segetis TaxID=1325360 RepID=A0ABQ1YTT3_9BACL|nr:alpha/beta fold hydrolase [Paenibacillus segetis]GGH38506.1 hypothetical protein GCM10008013_46640 [Paenibacillus segetis]
MSKNKKLHLVATTAMALSLTLPAISAFADPAQSGTAIAPVREVAAKLGANVTWDQSKQSVTITKDNHVLVLQVGDSKALIDGQSINLSKPVRLVQGHVLIEEDVIANALSVKVSTDTADLFLELLKSGDGAKAAEYVSPTMSAAIPSALLDQLWRSCEAQFGKATEQVAKSESSNAIHRNVTYTFKSTIPFDLTLRLNPSGQIDDLYLGVASASLYQKPSYDNAASYTEQEIVVGEGALALPGTLTMPVGKGPFPAVVLVHGSGTNNRDEAIGGAKPFRDIAAGLASQGIAVLRYDKVTYEHTFAVASNPKFTLKNETVDDAILAVKLLKETANIDASRIFVAGHSQGGLAMPLILDADKNGDIAGSILLAGPSDTFINTMEDQQAEFISRLKELGQDTTPMIQNATLLKSMADMLNDPQYSLDNLPANFPSQPAYWWFEQRGYKPSDLAKKQTGHMLVLQGENDVQVTMRQYEGWKTALKDRKDVEFKSYPKVNHLLAEYDGISVAAEYNAPSNVSKSIIDDIAAWIQKIK